MVGTDATVKLGDCRESDLADERMKLLAPKVARVVRRESIDSEFDSKIILRTDRRAPHGYGKSLKCNSNSEYCTSQIIIATDACLVFDSKERLKRRG